MGTTKSAVSRLEGVGKHSPSVSTLKKYARAVGCEVEIRLVPASRPASASSPQSLPAPPGSDRQALHERPQSGGPAAG
jgi:transcriptional regulator with XRE-family HTH domain